MLSVASLRKPSKLSTSYSWLLELLNSVGFETTGWQPGRIQRSLMTTFAAGNADLTELAKFAVEANFGPLAKGPALTMYSLSRYGNKRNLARRTRGPMRLTNKGSIPHTFEVGRLIVSDGAGVEFRNVTAGSIASGSAGSPKTLDLEFEAVKAGVAGSLVARGAVTRLVTQFAGVTVSNNVTAPPSPWYTVAGLDEESDYNLQRRNETKWALSSLILVKEGFEAVALQNGAIKVDIDDTNPRGAGTLDVYAASAAAPLGTAEMQALQLAFSKRVLNTEATWLNPWPVGNPSLVQVKHAPTQVLDLTGSTVYFTGELATVKGSVQQALRDLITLTPLGGYSYPPGPQNVITLGDLTNAIEESDGVATFSPGFTGDIAVASRHLVIAPADPYFGLTFTAVPG